MKLMSPTGEVTHASDTTLMAAACRAPETDLEDAVRAIRW